jgi:hypothetical protein
LFYNINTFNKCTRGILEMVKLFNRAKMTTATTGTGTITLGNVLDGYQSFSSAGVVDGDEIRYVIEEGNNWEIGTGTYTAADTTLTRTVNQSNNSSAAITLSGNAVVFISAVAEDFSSNNSNSGRAIAISLVFGGQ